MSFLQLEYSKTIEQNRIQRPELYCWERKILNWKLLVDIFFNLFVYIKDHTTWHYLVSVWISKFIQYLHFNLTIGIMKKLLQFRKPISSIDQCPCSKLFFNKLMLIFSIKLDPHRSLLPFLLGQLFWRVWKGLILIELWKISFLIVEYELILNHLFFSGSIL